MIFFRSPPQAAGPLFFLARSQGLAYLQMPKVACTSLKVALALLNRPELAEPLAATPLRIHAMEAWNDVTGAEDPVLRKLFRFTFVREPVARFLSMYRNKVLRAVETGRLSEDLQALGIQAGMSLDEVLDRVEQVPREQLDPHLIPQSLLLFKGRRSRADFIGKVEELPAGLREIERRTGVRLEVSHLNKTRASEQMPVPPTAEEVERIARLYEEDFVRLGYDRPGG